MLLFPTDDIQGWQDAVLKSLEKKHRAEQEFLMGLLQDESSKGMREEARAISEDDRLKRLSELKGKREELDLGVKGNKRLFLCPMLLEIFDIGPVEFHFNDVTLQGSMYSSDWLFTYVRKLKTDQHLIRNHCGVASSLWNYRDVFRAGKKIKLRAMCESSQIPKLSFC